MTAPKITAVAFDLGDTLVEFEGLPLNWEAHYPQALANLAKFLDHRLTSEQTAKASAVLKSFNTRLHPRIEEVSFATILESLIDCFGCRSDTDMLSAARAFFEVFRQRLRLFPDAIPLLKNLRTKKIAIGIFTDAPYGMPRELILEDVTVSGINEFHDVLISSTDVGFRKPSAITLQRLADALKCKCPEMIYVGNEKKDIEVAKAFGCRSILIDRKKQLPQWGQNRTVHSLCEIKI